MRTRYSARKDLIARTSWSVFVPYPNGAPEWIRTTDLRLRRATLYPAELRVRDDAEHPRLKTTKR